MDDVTEGPTLTHNGKYWYSSDSTDFNASAPGFAIPDPPAQTVNVGPVSIAGGTLIADGPLAVSHLVADAVAGGAASGLAFAADGVLDIVNAPSDSGEFIVPVILSNCVGTSNLSRWTLRINGRETTAKQVSVTPDGIRIGLGATILYLR